MAETPCIFIQTGGSDPQHLQLRVLNLLVRGLNVPHPQPSWGLRPAHQHQQLPHTVTSSASASDPASASATPQHILHWMGRDAAHAGRGREGASKGWGLLREGEKGSNGVHTERGREGPWKG
eukprot:2077198-Rhodomonas_salina.3